MLTNGIAMHLDQRNTTGNAVAAGRVVPPALRAALAGVGVALGVVVWLELSGDAAPMALPLRIGAILLLSVTSVILLLFSALAATEYWFVERAQLTISRRWWLMETIAVLRPEDVWSVEIAAVSDGAAERHHLVLHLRAPCQDVGGPFGPRWLNRVAGWVLRHDDDAGAPHRLRSPAFEEEVTARMARRLFLADL